MEFTFRLVVTWPSSPHSASSTGRFKTDSEAVSVTTGGVMADTTMPAFEVEDSDSASDLTVAGSVDREGSDVPEVSR